MELLIIFPWLQWFVWGKAFTQHWSQCDQHPTAFHTEHAIGHLQVKWWVLRPCPDKQQAHNHEVTAPRNNCLRRTCKKNANSLSDFRNFSFKIHSNRLWSIPWERRKKKKATATTTPSVTTGKSNARNSMSKEQEIGITVYFRILVLFWPNATVRTC